MNRVDVVVVVAVVVALCVGGVVGGACAPKVPCTSEGDCAHARVCADGECVAFDAGDVVDCSALTTRSLQYEVDYLDLDSADVTPAPAGSPPPPEVEWDLMMRFDNNGFFGFPAQNFQADERIGYSDVDLCDFSHSDVAGVELRTSPKDQRFLHTALVETSSGLWAVGLPIDLEQTQGIFEMQISYVLAP